MQSTTQPHRSVRLPHDVYARRRRWLIYGVLLLALIPLLVWATSKWNRPLSADVVAASPNVDAKRFTVLIMGADDRPGEPGRSDTMLLGFVDLNASSVKLLSIPRDSYVQIPGHGWDKINAAYAFGQVNLARQTVENLVGMPVDYTLMVNMDGFTKMVDAVGGVDINVDEDMDYEDPYDKPEPLKIHLRKGLQHLNGQYALGYVRFRHDAKSDWGRMERQQQFLKALLLAAKAPENLAKFPKLISLGLDQVKTNLSPAQLTKLALVAKDQLGGQSIASKTLSGGDLWTDDGYYLALDFADMRKTVHELAGALPDTAAQAKDTQDAGAYAAALPSAQPTPPPVATKPTPPPPANPAAGNKGGTPTTGTGAGAVTGKSPGTTPTPAPVVEPPPQSSDAPPPWPLVVVDGSGGTQSKVLDRLPNEGYNILSTRKAPVVQQSTIFWYSGSAQAAYQLKVLLPHAKFIKMSPGPGEPALKLVLGSDAQ